MPVLLTMGRGTGHGGSQLKNEVIALGILCGVAVMTLLHFHMTRTTLEFECYVNHDCSHRSCRASLEGAPPSSTGSSRPTPRTYLQSMTRRGPCCTRPPTWVRIVGHVFLMSFKVIFPWVTIRVAAISPFHLDRDRRLLLL